MRGINKVVVSGNVASEANFATLRDGTQACSFTVASARHTRGDVITAFVRVNCYIDAVTAIVSDRLHKGDYVIVEGELMNRPGVSEELTEVRAREIVFVTTNQQKRAVDGTLR